MQRLVWEYYAHYAQSDNKRRVIAFSSIPTILLSYTDNFDITTDDTRMAALVCYGLASYDVGIVDRIYNDAANMMTGRLLLNLPCRALCPGHVRSLHICWSYDASTESCTLNDKTCRTSLTCSKTQMINQFDKYLFGTEGKTTETQFTKF